MLGDAIARIPHQSGAEFEKLFTDNIQDMLMVSYLSNLTKAQLALTEKMSVMGLTKGRRRGGGGHGGGGHGGGDNKGGSKGGFGGGGDRGGNNQNFGGGGNRGGGGDGENKGPPAPLRDAIQ